MLTDSVHPTTIDGVKSLATQLRKQEGLKHSRALDLAAKAANCENFQHARRVLPRRQPSSAPNVLLTIYWYDKKKQHQIGRETLKIELSKPILEICGKPWLKSLRGFSDLRMVAADHFVCDTVAETQTYARSRLCTAARSLQFVQYTGLLPSRSYRRAYQKRWGRDGLPGKDHGTYWIDPANEQFILIDEPYARVPNEAERSAWAARAGWRIIKTAWPGMYNPYNCTLYVATEGSSNCDLDALVKSINAMPTPLVEEEWHGESSASWNTFLSPLAKTTLDRRRARCRGTIHRVSSATTIPYRSHGISPARRPAGTMGIDGHNDAGGIIKAVLQSNHLTYPAYNRLDSLRFTLADWMSLEIDRRQLKGQDSLDVYYGEAENDALYRKMARSGVDIIEMLRSLKQKLEVAYPDCAPLRQQLRRIDMSVRLIGS